MDYSGQGLCFTALPKNVTFRITGRAFGSGAILEHLCSGHHGLLKTGVLCQL